MLEHKGGKRGHNTREIERRQLKQPPPEIDLPLPPALPKQKKVEPFKAIFYGRDFVYRSLLVQLSNDELKHVPFGELPGTTSLDVLVVDGVYENGAFPALNYINSLGDRQHGPKVVVYYKDKIQAKPLISRSDASFSFLEAKLLDNYLNRERAKK